MNTTKITRSESEPLQIALLPTRPTAPSAFGGSGFTAIEMKAAFDRLPLLIIERFNSLVDDVTGGDICTAIPTGIDGANTLAALLAAFSDGTLASLIAYRDTTLTAYIEGLSNEIERLRTLVEGV